MRRVHGDDRQRVRRVLDRAAHAGERAVFEHRWAPSSRTVSSTTLLWCGAVERPAERSADVTPSEVLVVLLDVDGAHRYHHSADRDSVPALLSELAQLSAAVASRDIIGQAKGILMARHGCDADEAFKLLSALSNRTNVPVNAIAEHVATHKLSL